MQGYLKEENYRYFVFSKKRRLKDMFVLGFREHIIPPSLNKGDSNITSRYKLR